MLKEVVYCGVCSYPPEYCEFSGKLKRCKVWLQEANPDLYQQLYPGENAEVEGLSGKLAESSIGEKREEKLEKDLLKMQAKQENREQRELAKKLSSKIIIKREARTKRKSIVAIAGLEVFEIDMKKLAKTFASKFATGCSVSKNAEKKEEIVIQGDVMEEVESYLHAILAEKGLKNVKVEVIDAAAKKKKKPEGTPALLQSK
ncbi:TMA22 (YJR014W) [Zygosaccharomyces parabailii]|nr:TMA22 (YJR014W) [Zygosaccharomyces parabailii]CDH15476.1 probable Translation machinery-associated protein 22 [Zygosaccharomyces bailii ISA1307]